MRADVAKLTARIAVAPDRRGRLLSVPGCWDGLSALLVEQAGFEAAFLTGGGLSMARLGRPDMGLVTSGELVDTVMLIRDRVTLPLIVDGDTGFGNAVNLGRTVRMLERAGATAVQIEDQGFPKRCGHMEGKTVVTIAEALGRIRAALDTRDDMLVIARTDALAIEGEEAAIDRADAYCDAGADLVVVEGPRTMGELERVAERLAARIPLVHNLVEGGVTPTRDPAVLERLGFAIALHPLVLLHGLVAAAPGWLRTLGASGSTEGLPLVDLHHMNTVTGATELLEQGRRYGG